LRPWPEQKGYKLIGIPKSAWSCRACGTGEHRRDGVEFTNGSGTITTPLPSIIDWRVDRCLGVENGQDCGGANCRWNHTADIVRLAIEAVQIVAKPSDANGRAAMTTPVRADSGEFVAFWMPNGSINPAKGGMLLTLPDAAEQGMYAIVGREAPE
jgi:hypothetical protein